MRPASATCFLCAFAASSSALAFICRAPAFPFAGNTVFRVITQTGSNVIKSGGATNVFLFALPVASISAPAVFVMSTCGTLQMLSLTVTMTHPTSRLGVNSTRLVARDTDAVVLSGQLAPSTPALVLRSLLLDTSPSLRRQSVQHIKLLRCCLGSRLYRARSGGGLAAGARPAAAPATAPSCFILQIEVRSPPDFIQPSPAANASPPLIVFSSVPSANAHPSPLYPCPSGKYSARRWRWLTATPQTSSTLLSSTAAACGTPPHSPPSRLPTALCLTFPPSSASSNSRPCHRLPASFSWCASGLPAMRRRTTAAPFFSHCRCPRLPQKLLRSVVHRLPQLSPPSTAKSRLRSQSLNAAPQATVPS